MSLVVLLLAGAALGGLILRPFGLGGGLDGLIYRLPLGLSLCAVIILIAGSYSLALAQLILNATALAGLAWELRLYSREPRAVPRAEAVAETPQWVEWFCLAIAVVVLAMAFLASLAPVTGWDACVAHIALPMDYAREGRILPIEGNEYSLYPHLVHCLFALAFFQSAEWGVSMMNWVFAAIACGAVYLLGRHMEPGGTGRRTGIIAAGILAASPIFFDQATSPSIDLAFCAFTLLALAALAAFNDATSDAAGRRARLGLLLLAGCLVGASCGIRHTGYLTAVLLAVGVLAMARGRRLSSAAIFGAAVLVGALPWLARSAVLAGNPFYPFFAGVIDSGAVPHREITALAAHESIKETTWVRLLMFPWDIVMRPHWFDGWTKSPGGLILILGVPGLVIGGRRARALGLFTGAGLVSFFYFQRLARYLLPFFAPMMVVAAAAATASKRRALRYPARGAVVVLLLFGVGLDAAAMYFKVPVVLGMESRDDYLKRRVERYPMFEWVNKNLSKNDLLFTFDRRTYFLKGRSWQNNEPLRRLADRPVEEQLAWFRSKNIRYVVVPVDYIEESPGYRDLFGPMVQRWKNNSTCFTLQTSLTLPRARGSGTERVEVYRVKYP